MNRKLKLKISIDSWKFLSKNEIEDWNQNKQAQESMGSCDELSSAKLFNSDGPIKKTTYAHNE